MKSEKIRRLNSSYGILGFIWTLVVVASMKINAGSTEEGLFQKSLITHSMIWITAFMVMFYNYRLMTGALKHRKKTAFELEAAVASTEKLIDAVPFGMLIVGKDKIVRKSNREASRILGRPSDELLGIVCHQNVCTSQAGECPILDRHQKVDRSEKNVVGVCGGHIPVLKSVIPFNWHGEDVLLEAFVDISEHKKQQGEMERNLADLQKFNRLATGRELRMIELKVEINELLHKQGESDRYKIVNLDEANELVTDGALD